MKGLISTLLILMTFTSVQLLGQDEFKCEGVWQIKGSSKTFCHIIMLSNVEGETQPIATIEGLIDNRAFSVKCIVEEIPQRNSIVFRNLEETSNTKVGYERPVLILTTNKNTIERMIWGQVDLSKSKTLKDKTKFRIKKITIPGYRSKYKFKSNKNKKSLTTAPIVQ